MVQNCDGAETRSLFVRLWRTIALGLALMIGISPSALPISTAHGSLMDAATNNDDQIPRLVRILSGAYENSLLHGNWRADLKAGDVLLENASLRFAARAIYAMKDGSCRSNAPGVSADTCALADPSLALADWAEMLSYAAYQLDNLARSASAADASGNAREVVIERIKSMEHLYRMVFAVAKIYLDQAQGRAYLDAAQGQLALARQHTEAESNVCECDASAYAGRLLEMSELDEQMNDLRSSALP